MSTEAVQADKDKAKVEWDLQDQMIQDHLDSAARCWRARAEMNRVGYAAGQMTAQHAKAALALLGIR